MIYRDYTSWYRWVLWLIVTAVVGPVVGSEQSVATTITTSLGKQDRREFIGVSGKVLTAAPGASDNFYIAGSFKAVAGVKASNIAKWNGRQWTPLGTGLDGEVRCLAVKDQCVYVGGCFRVAGGVTANRIARWDGVQWSPLGVGTNDKVRAIVIAQDVVYAAGDFTKAGEAAANHIAAWDGRTWSALGEGLNGAGEVLASSGKALYVGGEFTRAGDISARRIARWTAGASWSALGTGANGSVLAIAVEGEDIYVGGEFTEAGGIKARRVAKWNGSLWSPLGRGVGGLQTKDLKEGDYGAVCTLFTSGSLICAGGMFVVAGQKAAHNVAAWDGQEWSDIGSSEDPVACETYSWVSVLMEYRRQLVAAGNFRKLGAAKVDSIARWNGRTWEPFSIAIW